MELVGQCSGSKRFYNACLEDRFLWHLGIASGSRMDRRVTTLQEQADYKALQSNIRLLLQVTQIRQHRSSLSY